MASVQISCLLLALGAIVVPATALLNGQNANIGSHPYSASLQRDGQHICGATLIGENLCLTAAHCVTVGSGVESYPARTFTVRLGSIQRLLGGQLAQVSRIIVHKNYSRGFNNLALLVLQSPVAVNELTRPIALASQRPATGTQVTYTGWGASQTQGTISQRLQVGNRKTLSATDCRDELYSDDKGVLCLASASETLVSANAMCIGDAGAPAVYNNQLVAIGSFYVGGCGDSRSDAFMDITYYLKWIAENSP